MAFSLAQLKQRQDLQAYLISGVLAVLLIVHLFSSQIVSASHAEQVLEHEAAATEADTANLLAKVEVQLVREQSIQQELQLYGRTAANRVAHIKAGLATNVEQILVPQGQRVTQQQALIRLDNMGLPERLRHAQLLVVQRKLEYQSAQALEQKGFQAKLFAVEKSTLLAQAKAEQTRLAHELSHSQLLAPFNGVLNEVMVEQGDWLNVGDPIAEVLELDPLIIKIAVPETQVGQLALGQIAQIDFLGGRQAKAEIRYISSQSYQNTNTFEVELKLANADFSIPAGISAQVTLFTQSVAASTISPAYLTLDQAGRAGVFVLEDGRARFQPTAVLKSSAAQLWVQSLGEQVQLVVAGQQALSDGVEVNVVSQRKAAALISSVE